MKTVINTSNRLAEGALQRLKVWFDPAMEGSPYEVQPPKRQFQRPQKSVFFGKKMVLKF